MKPFYILKLFLLLALSLLCGFKYQQNQEIIVYGSNSCEHCISLKSSLDSAAITYQFYDIDLDRSKEAEMASKLRQFNIRGNITIPVVDIYQQQLLVGATYQSIVKAIHTEK